MTHQAIISRVTSALHGVVGIDAVVLGGSRATGHDSADSDIDIGIYYGATASLDLDGLNLIANQLDDQHRLNLVTPPGGWGPWVNAGGWLEIDGYHVDLILRDTNRVARIIDESDSGRVQAHYQPGHPHAFVDVMYRGELAECCMLWCTSHLVTNLKSRAEYYPEALQRAMLEVFGFEALFSINLASKTVVRHDQYYLIAHVIRAISCLNQLIFAVNRRYCLNEKKAVTRASGLTVCPYGYASRIDQVLHDAIYSPADACDALQKLVDETHALMR